MRKMKMGIMLCAMCMLLGGCGNKQEFENPGQFSYKGKLISVGQSKEEVEKIIGADNEEIRITYSTQRTDGEEVYVAGNATSKDITTFGGIKVGDTKEKVQEKFPDCIEEGFVMTAFFEGSKPVEEIEDKGSESAYVISYSINEEDKISSVSFGDARGMWMQK